MAYRVPFVDYPKFYRTYKTEIKDTLDRVLSRGDLILRDDVSRIEKSVAGYCGTEYGVGLNSGTDALFFSLKAAGIQPGDEVITVSHTFLATIAVIVHLGAKPVLIDIGDDFNMNVDLVEEAITPGTKAIMPVHLNGRLCDMDKLMKIAAAQRLTVIEDAAQALGAAYNGRKAGSYGLAAGFSFYPAKNLGAYGDAGMVVTNDAEIARKVRLFRDHGRESQNSYVLFGYNSRLDNLQAAILNLKMGYFPEWVERRREIAALYEKGLKDLKQVILPPSPAKHGKYYDTYQYYVIRASDRDALASCLAEAGIETMISWSVPNHLHPGLKLDSFKLPKTEQMSREVLSLPMHTELDNEQVAIVIDEIRKFYKNKP